MRIVEPRVYLIAKTELVPGALELYLKETFGIDWTSDAESDAEKLVEANGRMCYRSWKPALNPNVTKIRENHKEYIENILRSKHGSVLEHSMATFYFVNVSRVFTHELVRHRAGVAISQESLRYVRLNDIGMWIPSCFRDDPNMVVMIQTLVSGLEEVQTALASKYGLDDGKDFATKKEITSAMRRLAPDGLATTIAWSANFRALRHVIEMRTALGAEEEIRIVFDKVAEIAKTNWPAVFQDFSRNEDGEWKPEYSKV